MCWKQRERISPLGREVLMGHFVVPGTQRWWDLAFLVLFFSLHVFVLLVVWLLETSLFRICFFFFFFPLQNTCVWIWLDIVTFAFKNRPED